MHTRSRKSVEAIEEEQRMEADAAIGTVLAVLRGPMAREILLALATVETVKKFAARLAAPASRHPDEYGA